MNSGAGHAITATSHMDRVYTGETTSTGDTATMHSSNETIAAHIERASVQMREHAAQIDATTHMQATEMEPGYGMQYDNMGTGTGYMNAENMQYGSGYMDSGYTGNMGSSTSSGTMGNATGSGSYMGANGTGGTGTTHSSGGGSMMGS